MPDAATPLPTTLAECHAMIMELATVNATLRATIDEQQTLLQALQRDLALMKRALFGQRRERFEDPRQAMLFDSVVVGELEPEDVSNQDDNDIEPDAASEEEGETPSNRAGRVRRVIPACLPRVQRIHELDEAEIPEHLQGDQGRRFLKKVGEFVEWEPPRLTVVEEFVETLAVDNADATETPMVSAPRPPRIIRCWLAWPSIILRTICLTIGSRKSLDAAN
jgi:hypothetical protein